MINANKKDTERNEVVIWRQLIELLPGGICNAYYQESLENCRCGHHSDCRVEEEYMPLWRRHQELLKK